jgi:acyl carrier protein
MNLAHDLTQHGIQAAAHAPHAQPCNAQELIALIEQELAFAPGRLNANSRVAELGDSLDWLCVLEAVEARWHISMAAAEAFELCTVADVVKHVAELQRV